MSILFQQLKGKSRKDAFITKFLGMYFTHSSLNSERWVKNDFRLKRRHCSIHLKLWLHSDSLCVGAQNMGKVRVPLWKQRYIDL